jgi:nicotinamidase-related amidase
MKRTLIVVDMQNDFIDGALGTKEAQAIVPNVVEKIKHWKGEIIVTQDTHYDNYLETREGKYLPVKHCIDGTDGHKINESVFDVLVKHRGNFAFLNKITFGSTALPEIIRGQNFEYIEIVGLCTDICVVSNAMLLKANYPEIDITVDASCCAGVTPESHQAALTTMKMCQINVIGE